MRETASAKGRDYFWLAHKHHRELKKARQVKQRLHGEMLSGHDYDEAQLIHVSSVEINGVFGCGTSSKAKNHTVLNKVDSFISIDSFEFVLRHKCRRSKKQRNNGDSFDSLPLLFDLSFDSLSLLFDLNFCWLLIL